MGIDVRQKQIRQGIILSALALAAFFMAQGTSRWIANFVLELDTTIEPGFFRRRSTFGVEAQSGRKDISKILARNIFDSSTGPLNAVPATETDDAPIAPETIDPNAPPPRCEGSVKLVGAFFVPEQPEWSFVALNNGSGPAKLYRQGMQFEGREIVAIFANSAYLRPSGSRMCSVSMWAKEPPPGTTASAETPAEPGGDERRGIGSVSSEDLDKGIKATGNGFQISRSLVNRLLENQGELMNIARVAPYKQGGQVVGVQLRGVRRGTLLERLGLKTGDVIRTINGFDMTKTDSQLQALSRLRTADRLTVQILRRGQPSTVDYSIR